MLSEPMITSEEFVTVAEAARILHRSIEQVRRYLREGKLPGQRIGGQWSIPRSALKSPEDGDAIYQRRMKLLKEVQELRQKIYAETGRLFDGAELVNQIREERDAELEHRLP